MGPAGMTDDQRAIAEFESIRRRNGPVGGVGELKPPHGIQPNHPHPIGDQRVLARLRGEHAAIGVGDDHSSLLTEHAGAEMMVRMMMGEDKPFDRPAGDCANRPLELLGLARAGQGVDDNDSGWRNHKPGVGPSLRAASDVSRDDIDTGAHSADWELGDGGASARGKQARESEGRENGAMDADQAEAKLMLIDCLKVAPLLSVQVMVSGASRSAFRVKLPTGSRLMPEVQSNRATSSPPYVTTTCLIKYAGMGSPSASRKNPVSMGWATMEFTVIRSPRLIRSGTLIRASPI